MPVMHCRAQQTGWVSQYCLLQLTVQITALYAITMSAKMLPEKKNNHYRPIEIIRMSIRFSTSGQTCGVGLLFYAKFYPHQCRGGVGSPKLD